MTLELARTRETAPTARADSPLALRGMTVSYGQKPAVFSVDMTVEPGKMTAIIGPNGAGKSTLLKAALGILTPLAGTATVYGKPVAEQRHRIAERSHRKQLCVWRRRVVAAAHRDGGSRGVLLRQI